MFSLHPRLKSDTFRVAKLETSSLYLMNDCRYKWLILVPEIENISELYDLGDDEYISVMEETRKASKLLADLYAPKKINVGALGNMVEQLHIHIIARHENDFAWPGPVWGAGDSIPYSDDLRHETILSLKSSI
ncbi:MAG: HIT domain-containing protein [Sneathiella sp.]|nr:HIT domain-containing protein [Sneathiella sp.]